MAHILVVDDERSICELLEITFRKDGHRVEVVTTGKRRAAGWSPAFSTSLSQIFAFRTSVA